MEGSDIYRASNSLRRSSTAWRNSGVEVFSRSSREEDDEEALKWAALEKLPTYNRLRKGLLTASHGVANEIDVSDLGTQERHKLLERLVKVAEEDNERFLLKLKERIDRYIHITHFFHHYTNNLFLTLIPFFFYFLFYIIELDLIFQQLKFDMSTLILRQRPLWEVELCPLSSTLLLMS